MLIRLALPYSCTLMISEEMALECLAILGTKNEPLYLRAPGSADKEAESPRDVFGFMETDKERSGLSIRQEVCQCSRIGCISSILLPDTSNYDIFSNPVHDPCGIGPTGGNPGLAQVFQFTQNAERDEVDGVIATNGGM